MNGAEPSAGGPPRRWRGPLAVVALLAALPLVDRALSLRRESALGPLSQAEWVWVDRDPRVAEAVAFYLVDDFDLDEVPAQATLRVVPGAPYWAVLNGRRIGAGEPGGSVGYDNYRVRRFLRTGRNRLVFEVRSADGTGGLLAALAAGEEAGTLISVSGSDWSVHRRHVRGLFDPATAIGPGEGPKIWGGPHAGRWSLEGPQPIRTGVALRKPRILHPRTLAIGSDGKPEWIPRWPPRSRPVGANVATFDWGRRVRGYVSVLHEPMKQSDGGNLGLLLFSDSEPAHPDRAADSILIEVPGKRWWVDSRVRSFRSLTVVGLPSMIRVEVLRPDGRALGEEATPASSGGAFGLEPPGLRTPAEHEVRRRLERVPGVAGR